MKKLISGIAAASVAVMSAFAFGMPAQAAPADVITFTDPAFQDCIGGQIAGYSSGNPITEAEAATITSLSCTGISSIEGAQYLTGLTSLSVQSGSLTDVSPAAGLVNTTMDFSANNILDFSSLLNVANVDMGTQQTIALPTLNDTFTQPLVLRNNKGVAPISEMYQITYNGADITYLDNQGTTNRFLSFYGVGSRGTGVQPTWYATQTVNGNTVPQPVSYTIDATYTFPGTGKPVPTTRAELNNTPITINSTFTSPDISSITMQGQAMIMQNGVPREFGVGGPYDYTFTKLKPLGGVESIINNSCPLELAVLHQGEITTQQILDACAANPTTTNWMYGAYRGTIDYQYSVSTGGTQQGYTASLPFAYGVLLPESVPTVYEPSAPYCVLNSYSKTGNDITVDFSINAIAPDRGAAGSYTGPDSLYPSDGYTTNSITGEVVPIAAGNTIQINDTTTGAVLYSNDMGITGSPYDAGLGQTFGDNLHRDSVLPAWIYNGTNGTSYLDPNDNTKRIITGTTNLNYTFADDVIGATEDRVITIAINTWSVNSWYDIGGGWTPESVVADGTTCSFNLAGTPVPPTPEPTPTPVPPTPAPTPGPLPDETKNGGVDNLPYLMFGGLLFIGLAGATLSFARKRKA